jgi:CxxC-x17-CxxC domain-containing protein
MADFRSGGTNRFSGGHGGHGGGFKGRGGDRGGFGGGSRGGFRGGDRGPVTMHKVICDECKKPCEVPFLPTAGKPVYCSACFGGKKEVGFDRTGPSRSGDRFPRTDYKTPPRTDFGADINKVSGSEIKKQIEVLNGKVDKLVKVIEFLTANRTSTPVESQIETNIVKESTPITKNKEVAKKAVKKVSKKK